MVPFEASLNNPRYSAKRAETRKCPVCDEVIPIRLLGKHAELEAERLEEIVRCIGSTEVLGEAEPEDRCVYMLVSEVHVVARQIQTRFPPPSHLPIPISIPS